MYQAVESRTQLEFDASRCAEIIDCFKNLHVVKINNVFSDHSLLNELRDAIEIADFFATKFESDGCSNKHLAFQRFNNMGWSREKIPALRLDDVPLASMAVERLLQSSAALQDLVQATFGTAYKRHASIARPAQSSNADRRTDWSWHQDKSISNDFDLTVWFPLTDCGVDAPGVQYLVGEGVPQLPRREGHWSAHPDAIDALSKTHMTFTPVFSLGDCIVSDGYAVHRTHATEQMTKERTSVDIRFAPA